MAAACQEKGELRIVTWADTRSEIDWAGANIAHKYDHVAGPHWHSLMAGELSKGKEIAATYRSVLKPEEFTEDNIYDKLNEAACVHKEKLTKQLVRKRLAMSYDRFLTKGEKELTSDVRNRTLYAIEKLEFGADLIVCGFLNGLPHIYFMGGDAEVIRQENFAAIGTGDVIAQSLLHYREQHLAMPLEKTLYHMYEAFLMAYQSKAPGVGDISQVAVLSPGSNNTVTVRLGLSSLMRHLDLSFQKYGPKMVGDIPPLPSKCLIEPQAGFKVVKKKMQGDG